ncbi:lasso peptide biosynthesis B2 protein [Saccharopolyspora sp. CA-218241]|uniref:lasso peptide biosynthesis B2 protein n=1 Tax=Saccharopolyspora sp. CA-218241 TaxID=3240027 RepID=UPI003D975903
MSVRVTGWEPAGPVRWWWRPVALVAVLGARVLGRLKPARLRRVLEAARRGARPATGAEARRALDAVLAVSVRCGGEWCLERAIATALTCRLTGTWPEWCTGVRMQPFEAHAWVAVDGEPIGENPHTMPHFRVVWSVPPADRCA